MNVFDVADKAETHGKDTTASPPDFQKEVWNAKFFSSTPDFNVKSPDDALHQNIEQSLHLHSSIPGYLGTGALTGGLMGGLEYAFRDTLMQKMPAASLIVKENSTLVSSIGTGAIKGIGIASATLAAGYAMDSLGSSIFGYKQPHVDGLSRFLVDGVAVPSILLSSLPTAQKVILGGSLLLGTRIMNAIDGSTESVQMSNLLRPNPIDGVLMTAAALAPVDAKTKAVLIGGAWLAGRAYSELAQLTGLNGKQPYELRDAAENALSQDMTKRSAASFANLVEKGKTLGKENEAALELQTRDWMDQQSKKAPVTFDRGAAALANALGQFRLESGTRLDLKSHADTKERILKDYNYDFGGEATTFLRMSAGSLVNAQQEVLKHKGEKIDGQVMDDAYSTQLKYLQSDVEKKLDLIYGPHAMDGIFKELTSLNPAQQTDLQFALVRMYNNLEVTQSSDKNFVAKQKRDLALGYLAQASTLHEKDSIGAQILFDSASQYLKASEDLVGNDHADNKALERIKLAVAKQLPGMVDEAMKAYLQSKKQ